MPENQVTNVSLAPGETKIIQFTVRPGQAETLNVVVSGPASNQVSTTFVVGPAPTPTPTPTPANIVTTDLVISPESVQVGQTVTITVKATNNGGTAGNLTIPCTITLEG